MICSITRKSAGMRPSPECPDLKLRDVISHGRSVMEPSCKVRREETPCCVEKGYAADHELPLLLETDSVRCQENAINR